MNILHTHAHDTVQFSKRQMLQHFYLFVILLVIMYMWTQVLSKCSDFLISLSTFSESTSDKRQSTEPDADRDRNATAVAGNDFYKFQSTFLWLPIYIDFVHYNIY